MGDLYPISSDKTSGSGDHCEIVVEERRRRRRIFINTDSGYAMRPHPGSYLSISPVFLSTYQPCRVGFRKTYDGAAG